MATTITEHTLTEPTSPNKNGMTLVPSRQGATFFSAHSFSGTPVVAQIIADTGDEQDQEVWLIEAGGNGDNATPPNAEKRLGVVKFASGRIFYVFV